MSVAARVALVLTLPTFIVAAFVAPDVHRATDRPTSYVIYGSRLPIPAHVEPREERGFSGDAAGDPADGDAGAVDLYGNEVTDAVAKYKLDSAGTLYELHSPQTEVPRLASPRS